MPSISVHKKWPEMAVSASTNQVWTKITIRDYACTDRNFVDNFLQVVIYLALVANI